MPTPWTIKAGGAHRMGWPLVVAIVLAVMASLISVGGPSASAAGARRGRPVVTGVSPNAGSTGETIVARITGERFTKHSVVTFGAAKYRASHVHVLSAELITARIPAHSLGNVHVHVTTANGTSASAVRNRYRYVRKPATLTTHAASPIMPAIGEVESLSCPTSTFCMGTNGKDVFRTNGSTVATPVPVGFDAFQVSCASPQLCVASGFEDVSVYNGTAWGAPTQLSTRDNGDLGEVSCAPDGYCVVVGAGHAYAWNGSGWTAQSVGTAGATPQLIAVSCVSASFCVAGERTSDSRGRTGHTYRFDGTSWTDLGPLFYTAPSARSDRIADLSCASTTFCVALGSDGEGAVFHGTTWAAPTNGFPPDGQVSCAAGPICVVLGAPGVQSRPNTMTSTGHGWSHANLAAALTAAGEPPVTCTSPTLCRAVTAGGWAYSFDGATWSNRPARVERPRGKIVGLSCPSTKFCAAVDHNGWVSTSNGRSWTASRVLDPSASLTALSCATATSCVAVDDRGNAFRYRGTTWSGPTEIDTHGLTSVSCATARWCVAVDDRGNAVAYSAARWHPPHQLIVRSPLTAVACSSTHFCMAVSADGRSVRYRNGWQHAQWMNGVNPSGGAGYDGIQYIHAVSCTSPSYCVAGEIGGVQFFTGTAWSWRTVGRLRFIVDYHDIRSVSCVSESFCGVADQADPIGRNNDVITMNGANLHQQRGPHLAELISCVAVNRCLAATDTSAFSLS
jgi:hypothetical protein